MMCPLCGKPSDADWPLRMADGSIRDGGCQMCWERQCSEEWWEMVAFLTASPKSTPAAAERAERERDALRAERDGLRQRIADLEAEVGRLR